MKTVVVSSMKIEAISILRLRWDKNGLVVKYMMIVAKALVTSTVDSTLYRKVQ